MTFRQALENDIRYYYADKKRYPSVTSAIKGGLPAPGLEKWKQNQIAIKAADNRKALALLTKADTLAFLKAEENADIRTTASDHGTSVHSYAEAVIKGQPLPVLSETGRETAEQFELFCREYNPEFTDSEFTCFSDRYGYAGTADAECIINGTRYILDFKTGKRIWPEVALQLAAYDNADWIRNREGATRPVERLGKGLVLHLRPDFYQLIEVDIGDNTFSHFLSILDTFNWIHMQSDHVLLGELAHDE